VNVTTRVADLRAALAAYRHGGRRIGLVPTMGALHDGHLALVDAARAHADVTVMSVFVNPLQFGPGEDFAAYPRDVDGDRAKASARGVDVYFAPENLYAPGGIPVLVTPEIEVPRWEAAIRPGHFTGVLTVVAKLFNIVQPDVAVFGQKDIQQVTIVRALVRALDFPLSLVVAPIVRESDGLAMSSRNVYLSADERVRARSLSRALRAATGAWDAGARDAVSLEAAGRAVLDATPGVSVDYFAVVETERLEPATIAEAGSIIIVAARVGRTRLLDNVILGA
jgi:pantoate--beta-alanine ligase